MLSVKHFCETICEVMLLIHETSEVNTLFERDNLTGEIRELPNKTRYSTEEEREFIKNKIAQRQAFEEMRKAIAKNKNDKCGWFFWSLYDVAQDYHPEVSDDMLVKIIYLLTYMDYKHNMLVSRQGAYDAYRPMKREDVRRVIRLHDSKFPNFWSKLIQSGIISENDCGELIVCDEFRRGKVDGRTTHGMSMIKIFSHAVRYLYENTDVRSHKYLAYLYRLIPYINLKYNVLCFNPLETNKHRIKLVSAGELCEIVGMENCKKNEDRLINSMLKLSFYDKSKEKWSVITVIKRMENDELRQYITINPLFYAGYISLEDTADIMNEFFIEERSEISSAAS